MSRVKALSVTLGLSLLMTATALAQTRSATPGAKPTQDEFAPPATVEECADIEQGVQRLQCYDTFLQPDQGGNGQTMDPDLVDAAESLGMDGQELKDSQDEQRKPSLVEQILARQRAMFSYSGAFVRHRGNYLLPITYVDSPNDNPRSANFGRTPLDEDLSNIEAKFQFSVRMPVFTGLLPERTNLWVAFTQLSFWQAYNSDESSPFRESNYEPEIFFSYEPSIQIGPGSIDLVSIGINHQSNGRSDPFSRSWNRFIANVVYSNDRWVFSARPWYRIPESTADDNNPDIEQYLGYADYNFAYKLAEDTTIGLMFRNNFSSSNNRSTFRLDYTFSLSESVSAYVQYYHGWGESLIDYNNHVKRFGVGITISDLF